MHPVSGTVAKNKDKQLMLEEKKDYTCDDGYDTFLAFLNSGNDN